jgi:tRNA(Glu) U13 pseudouridine synthase TruD
VRKKGNKMYEKALAEFYKLKTVNDDDLDGTINHLVFRAQHELDLEDEGENEYIEFELPKGEYAKLTRFVKKWSGK